MTQLGFLTPLNSMGIKIFLVWLIGDALASTIPLLSFSRLDPGCNRILKDLGFKENPPKPKSKVDNSQVLQP